MKKIDIVCLLMSMCVTVAYSMDLGGPPVDTADVNTHFTTTRIEGSSWSRIILKFALVNLCILGAGCSAKNVINRCRDKCSEFSSGDTLFVATCGIAAAAAACALYTSLLSDFTCSWVVAPRAGIF